ncbi:MAG TPA: nuclear transport factor 2 family protein [Longimicrobiales bacterium]|nr:nuclear transport factor 2 family protein [Longimicrobiales bacterium]
MAGRRSRITGVLHFAAALLALAAAPASAQHAGDGDIAAVRAVVDMLFDGMRERDTVKMRTAFHPDARLYGAAPDGSGVRVTQASEFVASISQAPEGLILDEVIDDVEIRVDGPLATAWMYYDFFAGDNFSHCGYNAFQLLNVGGEWQVVSVTDSRRREGCRQQRAPAPR